MHVTGGHGNENPNVNWLDSRGFYVFYLVFICVFHLIILSLPFLTIPMAWTVTNIGHNIVNLYFLHFVKGTPWYTSDILTSTDEYKRETHFEQLDSGSDFSWTQQKKFLFVMPIILFLLTCLYTQNSEAHFFANFISLIVVILPKLPSFHHVRILGINKY